MTNKTIIVVGSPRPDGNTMRLAKEMKIQLKDSDLFVVKNSSKPCNHCGRCSKTNVCVINDELTDLFKLWNYTHIVLASPIYCFYLSAQIKIFIDRMVINNLNNVKFAGLFVGGSSSHDNGVIQIVNTLKRLAAFYDNTKFVGHYYKQTNDKVLPVSNVDKVSINKLIQQMGGA